jgi:hypothetical protein
MTRAKNAAVFGVEDVAPLSQLAGEGTQRRARGGDGLRQSKP